MTSCSSSTFSWTYHCSGSLLVPRVPVDATGSAGQVFARRRGYRVVNCSLKFRQCFYGTVASRPYSGYGDKLWHSLVGLWSWGDFQSLASAVWTLQCSSFACQSSAALAALPTFSLPTRPRSYASCPFRPLASCPNSLQAPSSRSRLGAGVFLPWPYHPQASASAPAADLGSYQFVIIA